MIKWQKGLGKENNEKDMYFIFLTHKEKVLNSVSVIILKQ